MRLQRWPKMKVQYFGYSQAPIRPSLMANTCLKLVAGKSSPNDLVKGAPDRPNVAETPTESQNFKVNTAARG